MKVYVVTTNVDPFSSDECPVLLFQNYPTREEVAKELEQERWFEGNRSGWEEDNPDEEYSLDNSWGWGYDVQIHNNIINNKGVSK